MRLLRIFGLLFFLWWGFLPAHAQLFDPVAADDAGSVNEDTELTLNIVSNDSDADVGGAINPATVDLDPGTAGQQTSLTNAQGEFEVDPLGVLTYTPDPNFHGQAIVTYVVRDLLLTLSNVATVIITVNSINDLPVINSQVPLAMNENQSLVLSLSNLSVT